MELPEVEWIAPIEKETYRVRIAVENYKDQENMLDERRNIVATTNQTKKGNA